MKGTMGLSQISGKPENVKAPPVCMRVVSSSYLLRPRSKVKAKAPALCPGPCCLLFCCGLSGLEECCQFCADFDHTLVYGDIADFHGGGDFPLGLALHHPTENDLVFAVQTVVEVL